MADLRRRDVLRYGAAGAVTTATALIGGQAMASNSSAARRDDPADVPWDFDEVYKKKKVKVKLNRGGKDELRINDKKLAFTTISTLFIPEDGSEPYVSIGYISALNHYDPVEIDRADKQGGGLKKLARKVVDILGDLELSDEASMDHRH